MKPNLIRYFVVRRDEWAVCSHHAVFIDAVDRARALLSYTYGDSEYEVYKVTFGQKNGTCERVFTTAAPF